MNINTEKMKTMVVYIIFLVFRSISFVSSDDYILSPSSSSSSQLSSLSSSPSSGSSASPILSALTSPTSIGSNSNQPTSQSKINPSSSSSSPAKTPAIKLNYLPNKRLNNVAKRFLKRFDVDLSTINHGPNFLLSSPQSKHYQPNNLNNNNNPSIESPSSSSPKLFSIDLSILDKPLTLPMVYYGDIEDLSFPRDSRSNEIEDNLNQVNDNYVNTEDRVNEELIDYNDDMPNEIPLEPVYLDDDANGYLINEHPTNDEHQNKHQSPTNLLHQQSYHLPYQEYQFNLNQLPDHLWTGNDALSDYLSDLRSTANQQHGKQQNILNLQQQSLPSPYSIYHVSKSNKPNSIVDLFTRKSNSHYLNHEQNEQQSPQLNLGYTNWFNIGQPDLLTNDVQTSSLLIPSGKSDSNQHNLNHNQPTSQQQQKHGVTPRSKSLIVDKSNILTNHNYLHHHQHQLPFKLQSTDHTKSNNNNSNNVQQSTILGQINEQPVNRANDRSIK